MRGRATSPLFPPNDVEMNPVNRKERRESNVDEDEDDDEEEEAEDEAAESDEEAYDTAVKNAQKESLRDLEAEIYSRVQRDLLRLPKPGTVPPVSKPQAPQQNSQDVSNQNFKEICLGNFVKV